MGSNDTEPQRRLKVVVIGAGIGGLTVAVGLRQDGHEVTVLEQANEFGEVSDNVLVLVAGFSGMKH